MSLLDKYKFSNKTHPLLGIMSFLLGVISVGAFVAAITLSVRAGGEVAVQYVLAVILGAVMSVAGVVLGIIARRKRECYYLFPNMGIALNGLMIVIIWVMITEGIIAG